MRLAEDGPVGFGKSGSFEGFCSGGGIAQLARSKAVEAIQNGLSPAYCPTMEGLEAISAKTVAEAAHAGDATAQKVYRLCGEKLGMGLALITDIINPEIIVIGSIFERSHSLLWPAAKEVWEREASFAILNPAVESSPACLGDSIGDYAALSVAFQPS